jgi:hypothetical protein
MDNQDNTGMPSPPPGYFYGIPPAPNMTPDQGGFPGTISVNRYGVTAKPAPQPRSEAALLKGSGKQEPQANPQTPAPFYEYLNAYKGDGVKSWADAKPADVTSLADQYADTIYKPYIKSVYPKISKEELDGYVNQFKFSARKNMGQIQKTLLAQESAQAAAAPPAAPAAPGALDTATGLGKQALASAGEGISSIVGGIPNVISSVASNPLFNPTNLIPSFRESNQQAGDVFKKPAQATADFLRQGAQEYRPGGDMLSSQEAEAVKQHPTLTAISNAAGGVVPIVTGSALGGGLPALGLLGAAQGAGSAGQDQRDRIGAMNDKDLAKLPEYQKLLAANGGDANKAKEKLAEVAANAAAQVGEAFGAVFNTLGGGGMTKPVQAALLKNIGPSIIKRALATAGIEATGLTGLTVGENAASTAAVNKKTGENSLPDLTAGAEQSGIMGLILGGLGTYLHAHLSNKNPLAKKSSIVGGEKAPEGTPDVVTGLTGDHQTEYKSALGSVLKQPGTIITDKAKLNNLAYVTQRMNDAWDQMESMLRSADVKFDDSHIAQARNAFISQWSAANGLSPDFFTKAAQAPAAPQSAPTAPEAPKVEAAPVTGAEAEAAAGGVPVTPLTHEEAAHKEAVAEAEAQAVHAAKEAPERQETRTPKQIAIDAGASPAIPVSILEKVIPELMAEKGGIVPSAAEINGLASRRLNAFKVAIRAAHPEFAKLSDSIQTEAIGKALEGKGTAKPEQVLKIAQDMQDTGSHLQDVADRYAEFNGTPKVKVKPKNALPKGPEAAPPTPASEVAPPVENPLRSEKSLTKSGKLPPELSKSKPRFGFGGRNTTPEFRSDFDKAAYILRNGLKKSKADAQFLDWAKKESGLTEEQIRDHGKKVADEIKKQAKAGKETPIVKELKRPKTQAAEQGSEAVTAKQGEGEHLDLPEKAAEPAEESADKDMAASVRSAIVQAKAAGRLRPEVADFATWLLDRAPHLAKGLKIKIGGEHALGAVSGAYNALRKTVSLFNKHANVDTATHEILHHTERMMPNDVRTGIRQAWYKDLNAAIDDARESGDAKREAALQTMKKLATAGGDNAKLVPLFRDGSLDRGTDYHLTNPSEYWAVNGSRILADRYAANTWMEKARQWLKEFAEHAKGAFGLKSDSPILKALKAIHEGNGDFVQSKMLSESVSAQGDQYHHYQLGEEPPSASKIIEASKEWTKASESPLSAVKRVFAKGPESDKPTAWQNFAQKNVNTLKHLLYFNQAAERSGHRVKAGEDMYKAFTLLSGRREHLQSENNARFISPFLDVARTAADKLGMDHNELLRSLSLWLRGKDAVETNRRGYLQNARLTDKAHKARQELTLKYHAEQLPEDDYLRQLEKIVNASGARLGGDTVGSMSGVSDDEAYKIIAESKKTGLTKEVAEQLNEALRPLREQIFENQLISGAHSPSAVNLAKAYKSKYYVPKFGFAEGDVYAGRAGNPLGAFAKQDKAQEGRNTAADDPLQNLFRKLLSSAKQIADNEATRTVFNAARRPDSKMGAIIRTYDMDKLSKDAIQGGGQLAAVNRLTNKPNTLIYNNGKYRNFIELPEDSPILKSLTDFEAPKELGAIYKGAGVLTSGFGRLKTAYAPSFTMATAVVRDFLYVPGMLTLQGRIKDIPAYVGNYVKTGGAIGGWAHYLGELAGFKTYDDLVAHATANPTSFAGGLYRLSKQGGLLNFREEFNKVKNVESLVKDIQKQNQSNADPRKVLRNLVKAQDAIASGSINAGRVALFLAQTASGVSERDAAFNSQKMLDYRQTAEGARKMNSLWAFSRVALTGADATFQALKNEKGQIVPSRAISAMIMLGGVAGLGMAGLKSALGDKYKDITDDAISKNIILYNPWSPNNPLQFPIGLGGPRLAYGTAALALRLANGDTNAASAGRAWKNLLLENLSPIHPDESKPGAPIEKVLGDMLFGAVPTVALPVSEAIRNTGHFGQEIHTPPDYTKGYASEAGWPSTLSWFKDAAEGLRKTTGLDVYPETIQHLVTSYDPGIFTTYLSSVKADELLAKGGEPLPGQGTIFSALFNHDIKYAGARDFDRAETDLSDAKKEANSLKTQGKPIPPEIQQQVNALKKLDSARKEYSIKVKAVEKQAGLSPQDKYERVNALKSNWLQKQKELAAQAEQTVR